ncbi:hypothetical protein Droror1_Dr00009457 [Drosera rotundifolia]
MWLNQYSFPGIERRNKYKGRLDVYFTGPCFDYHTRNCIPHLDQTVHPQKYKKKPLPCLFVAKNQQRGRLMNDGGCTGASGGGNSSGSGGRGMMMGRQGRDGSEERCCFQMPLHYPRYSKSDYEAMPEWQLDRLLEQYGLPAAGSVEQKRIFAIGAFLWGR